MDKLLLSVVVVSGLCAVSSAAEHRYHVIYDLKIMTEAQRHCREKYIDLVTIRDLEDLKTLNTMLDLSRIADYRAWIGLYDDVGNWRWSASNRSFYKPGETEFRRWIYGEPSNSGRDEHCTWMNTNGEWNDYNCDRTVKPVCFDVRGPDETFVLINTFMTWTDAQSYCREHHTDLAMVRNMEENLKVRNLIPWGDIVWIGLFRDGWTWSDGSDSSFRNWKRLEPGSGSSENCVSADFSANGQWETLSCNVMSAFICYSVPVSKRVMKVRLEKRSSSLDLNDLVVKEGLLKQLKQRLKDQRLNDDIKLSWKKQSDGKVFHKEEEDQEEEKR